MNIGIDISQVVYEGTGVSRFTNGLIEAILDYDTQHQWSFFFSSLRQKLPAHIANLINRKHFRLIRYPIPPTLLSLFWNRLGIGKIEHLVPGLDWFISSDWTEPPTSKIRKATIVHDLTYLRFPETVKKNIRDTQTHRLARIKSESQLIFTDSAMTRHDLVSLLHIDNQKIVANYPGVSVTHPSPKETEKTLTKYGLRQPFILAVGKTEPRKNYPRLIAAFNQLGVKKIELVIAGPQGWGEFKNQAVKQNDNVRFLGLVTDQDLYSLYASCLFFIFPSLWEGFGYPLIEAMLLKAAVACSNTSSLKELGENHALLFDPVSTENMTQVMHTLINDRKLRLGLGDKGQRYAASFTWNNYYYKMIQALTSFMKPL